MTSSKHSTLNVRTSCVSDAPAIVEIEQAVFPDPYSLDTVLRLIEEGYAFALVCENGQGEICGYLLAQCIPPEAELLRIAVSQAARRMGAGSALMAKFLAVCRARGASELFLEVRASNEAAMSLYRAFGFTQCGVRKQYYKHPCEDAYLFSRIDQKDAWSGNVCTACPQKNTEER